MRGLDISVSLGFEFSNGADEEVSSLGVNKRHTQQRIWANLDSAADLVQYTDERVAINSGMLKEKLSNF